MEQVPVVIVGAGPVGLVAANLLGTYGISTLLLERSTAPYTFPRAVSMDDETSRTLQTIGLAEEVTRDVLVGHPWKLYGRRGQLLTARPSTRGELGYYRRGNFLQMRVEELLRAGLRRFPHVSFRTGWEVNALRTRADGATVRARNETGEELEIDAQYVLGCDGGRSAVRTLSDVELEGRSFPQKWLVIDCANDTEDEAASCFYGDPVRPAISISLPHRYRRWEFVLFPGESDEAVTEEAFCRSLIAKHSRHSFDLLHRRVYTHHARQARTYRNGRALLLGDAAHLMPPFAGSGMNTGVRDANNLCWKVAEVVRGRAGDRLIDTYELERRPLVDLVMSHSVTVGRLYLPTSRLAALKRDLMFWLSVRNRLARRFLDNEEKPPTIIAHGFLAPASPKTISVRKGNGLPSPLGKMFIQPHVRHEGREILFDELLGKGFAIISRTPVWSRSSLWQKVGARFVTLAGASDADHGRLDDERTFSDPSGALRRWLAQHESDYVILRPDRYVAAVGGAAEFDRATAALEGLF